jgi:hypothetical protein
MKTPRDARFPRPQSLPPASRYCKEKQEKEKQENLGRLTFQEASAEFIAYEFFENRSILQSDAFHLPTKRFFSATKLTITVRNALRINLILLGITSALKGF